MNAPAAASRTPHFESIDDFLAWAAAQEDRYELVEGVPVMMVGGSLAHAQISRNLVSWLSNRLLPGPCEPLGSDFGIELSGARANLRYPDASVLCSGGDQNDNTRRVPVLIVEVLSPSTEAYDRGVKAQDYRRLPSLLHLLLVEQARHFVEHYHRRSTGEDFVLTEIEGIDAAIDLQAFRLMLPMAALYSGVDLL